MSRMGWAEEKAYRIGPENLLQIDVHYGKAEVISQKVRVSSRNLITFPLIGEVSVEGLTVSELENKLYTLLEKDYLVNPQVNVIIEEYSTISVMGEVKKPGVYPLKGRLTVIEAISLSEGFTKIASPNRAKIVRVKQDGTKIEIPVRLNDIMKGGKQISNIDLQAGDVVMVPESLF
jgi:protein involved in polysaccharide export with SLBB domain